MCLGDPPRWQRARARDLPHDGCTSKNNLLRRRERQDQFLVRRFLPLGHLSRSRELQYVPVFLLKQFFFSRTTTMRVGLNMMHSARPLGTCSDSIQCHTAAINKRRLATLPAGPSKCHGAVPALGVPGRCVLELPPEPWNFTYEYKYPPGGRPRGSPLLKTGEPCLPLTEHLRVKEGSFNGEHEEWTSSKKSRGASPLSKGPRVAVNRSSCGRHEPSCVCLHATSTHRVYLRTRGCLYEPRNPRRHQGLLGSETLIRAGEAGSIGMAAAYMVPL